MRFNIENIYDYDERKVEKLFVMIDEKIVGSQFNNNADHMIKAAVIFENTELIYKYKKKQTSTNRYRLINSHTCASIDNELLSNTVDYIYNTYDVNYTKEIIFMGDCATWIKNFPNSHWFKFSPNISVKFAMDGFHFSQALNNLTTQKFPEVKAALNEYVLKNKKNDFIRLCNEFLELYSERAETIESKRDYILNNWNARQIYQNNSYMKCSMESHISHIFADIFTSRPKVYSKKGLRQLLKLRLLKTNGKNIKELYLNQLNQNISFSTNVDKINFDIFDKKISNYNPLNLINNSVYSKLFDTAYFYTYK